MEAHFAPELQAKIDQLVSETGTHTRHASCGNAMAGYVVELAGTREMLNSRYDDLKNGKEKLIDGEGFFESLGSAKTGY